MGGNRYESMLHRGLSWCTVWTLIQCDNWPENDSLLQKLEASVFQNYKCLLPYKMGYNSFRKLMGLNFMAVGLYTKETICACVEAHGMAYM